MSINVLTHNKTFLSWYEYTSIMQNTLVLLCSVSEFKYPLKFILNANIVKNIYFTISNIMYT